MNTINIVPIAEEHIEGFHACYDVVARERRYIAYLQAPPIENMRKMTLDYIAKGNLQLVALDDSQVVGWCSVIRFELEGFKHRGRLGIGLLPEYRGRGIGGQLMTAAIDGSRQIGLERVELGVFGSNVRAIELYRRLGFETEGVKRHARRMDEEYDDMVEMALFL